MAFTCLLVAILAAVASFLGVFARGTGAVLTVTSPRGETFDMATTGVYAFNAQRVVAEGVGRDIVTLALAIPVLLVAVPLVARGTFRGRLFGAGLLGYHALAMQPLARVALAGHGLCGVASRAAGHPPVAARSGDVRHCLPGSRPVVGLGRLPDGLAPLGRYVACADRWIGSPKRAVLPRRLRAGG